MAQGLIYPRPLISSSVTPSSPFKLRNPKYHSTEIQAGCGFPALCPITVVCRTHDGCSRHVRNDTSGGCSSYSFWGWHTGGKCRFGTRVICEWSWEAFPQILEYLPILSEMVPRLVLPVGIPLFFNILYPYMLYILPVWFLLSLLFKAFQFDMFLCNQHSAFQPIWLVFINTREGLNHIFS